MTFYLREVGKLSWFKYKSPKGKRSDIIIKKPHKEATFYKIEGFKFSPNLKNEEQYIP